MRPESQEQVAVVPVLGNGPPPSHSHLRHPKAPSEQGQTKSAGLPELKGNFRQPELSWFNFSLFRTRHAMAILSTMKQQFHES